jgi:hypothetical protein
VHYIDITPFTREAVHDVSLVAEDGLHPSGKDYKRWAALVAKKIGEIIAELDKIIAMCDGIKLGESPKPKEEKKEDKSKIQKKDDTKDFSDFTMVGKKGKNKRGSGETEEDPGPSVDSQIERTGKPKKEEPKTVKSFLKNQAKKRGIIN